MKNTYKFFSFLAALLIMTAAINISAQTTITLWDFEGSVITPISGAGTAALTGGTTATFATGNPTGIGWNSSTYPAQGTLQATAGVTFTVSTNTYRNIFFDWEQRHSNSSANRIRVQFTLDGTTWSDFQASATNAVNARVGLNKGFDNGRYIADSGDRWYIRKADFSAITGANNNASFAVRVVSEFFDGTNYSASTLGSAYATSGTLRYDNVRFSGTLISGIGKTEARMVLYPSPTSDRVYVSLPRAGMWLKVYNSRGQLVARFKAENTSTSLSLASYGKGMYIVESVFENGFPFARTKVVVN